MPTEVPIDFDPWILTSIHPVPAHLAHKPDARVLGWHIIHAFHMSIRPFNFLTSIQVANY